MLDMYQGWEGREGEGGQDIFSLRNSVFLNDSLDLKNFRLQKLFRHCDWRGVGGSQEIFLLRNFVFLDVSSDLENFRF